MNQTSSIEMDGTGISLSSRDLREVLDANARERMDSKSLSAALAERCRGDAEATWEALSLLDQYHRRGILDTDAFQVAKRELNALIFGTQSDYYDPSGLWPAPKLEPALREITTVASGYYTAGEPEARRETDSADESPDTILDEHAARDWAHGDSLRAGTVLCDRYVLVAPIESTTTSTIFKAFDRQRAGLPVPDSFVFVKCLRDEFATNVRAQNALRREFSVASKLLHPNILTLYDYHQGEDGCFVVMEAVQGQRLNHVIERFAPNTISRPQALEIIREIGLALAYAHSQGVTHANLEPAKIAILPSGQLRVFGFSAVEQEFEDDASAYSGRKAGAPVYRSEQSMRDRQVDASDDLFSLACIAYQLLYGHAPFIRDDWTIIRIWRRIAGLPIGQRRAIRNAFHPDRAQRPANVREWLFAFDSADPQRKTSLSELLPAPARSSRGRGSAHIAAGILTLVAIALFATWFAVPALRPHAAQIEPRERAASLTTSPSMVVEPAKSQEPPDAENLTASGTSRQSDASELSPTIEPALVSPTAQLPALPTPAITQAVAATPPIKSQVPAKLSVSFLATPISVSEDEAAAKLAVRRTGSTRRELLLHWRTLEGSAKANKDFAATQDGVLTFPPGERTAVILVPIIQHEERRFSDWFEVELTSAATADLGPIANATVLIVSARSVPDAVN
jgi:serine/threonine protein kinase